MDRKLTKRASSCQKGPFEKLREKCSISFLNLVLQNESPHKAERAITLVHRFKFQPESLEHEIEFSSAASCIRLTHQKAIAIQQGELEWYHDKGYHTSFANGGNLSEPRHLPTSEHHFCFPENRKNSEKSGKGIRVTNGFSGGSIGTGPVHSP